MPAPIRGPLQSMPEQLTHGCTLALVDERGRIIARSPDMGSFERASKAYGPTFARLADAWNMYHELHAALESGLASGADIVEYLNVQFDSDGYPVKEG